MPRKFKAFILALLVFASLLVTIPAAEAMPVLQGKPEGTYCYTTMERQPWGCINPGWNDYSVRCLRNEDPYNLNITIGFGTNGVSATNSYDTYQGLLLRHWIYCWSSNGLTANAHSVVVGNGYCINYQTYALRQWISGPTYAWNAFGVQLSSGAKGWWELTNPNNVWKTGQNTVSLAPYKC